MQTKSITFGSFYFLRQGNLENHKREKGIFCDEKNKEGIRNKQKMEQWKIDRQRHLREHVLIPELCDLMLEYAYELLGTPKNS